LEVAALVCITTIQKIRQLAAPVCSLVY